MSDTNFNFPEELDQFEPVLINDETPVNADHVLDLRSSILEIQRTLIGPSALELGSNNLIELRDSIKEALEKIDQFAGLMISELDLIYDGYFDGYASRIQTIETELTAHRSSAAGVDSEGFQVHGVDGYVVGTNNKQILYRKIIDTTNEIPGTKLIIRAHPSDQVPQMIFHNGDGDIVAWIDSLGNARFHDITIDGYTIQAGVDIIQNSLIVDGYSILGNPNSPTDYLVVNGPTTFNGDVTISNGNLSLSGTTGQITTSTSLTIDSPNSLITGSLTIESGLSVEGPISLGGADDIIIRSSTSQTTGYFHVNDFRAGGDLFRVESDTTTVKSTSFNVESVTSIFGSKTTLNSNGNITSNGTSFVFGEITTKGTNSFVIQGNSLLDGDLVVAGAISATSNSTQLNSLSATTASFDTLVTIGTNEQLTNLEISGGLFLDSQLSTSALEISHTGSGAILDLQTGSVTRPNKLLLDNEGRLVLGYHEAIPSPDWNGVQRDPLLNLVGEEYYQVQSSSLLFSGSLSGGPSYCLGKSRGIALGDHAKVEPNDLLGSITFASSDGSTFINSAAIEAVVDGATSQGNVPGRLNFKTTQANSTQPTSAMSITSDGYVGIGTENPTSNLEVAGSTSLNGVVELNASVKLNWRQVPGVTPSNNFVELITPSSDFYQMDADDLVIVATPSERNLVVSLPLNQPGKVVVIKRLSQNYLVTLVSDGTSSDGSIIDGEATQVLANDFDKLTLLAVGSQQWVSI